MFAIFQHTDQKMGATKRKQFDGDTFIHIHSWKSCCIQSENKTEPQKHPKHPECILTKHTCGLWKKKYFTFFGKPKFSDEKKWIAK